jgi:DMSO/TMAO reductase YedYZ molybdopterin-dependent catalytic subunit
MRNQNKVQWIVLFFIVLASIAILTSCSQEISGARPGLSPTVSSPAEAAAPVTGTPVPPISDYRLVVDGFVDSPLSLTYDAILQYPSVSDNPWLICPGVFETQNQWTGVPVALILNAAGLKPEAYSIVFSSSDGYSQTLSLQEAQNEGVFLAYKCDGQVLSQNDGYPLRLVAKDQAGYIWVKWLTHIEVK